GLAVLALSLLPAMATAADFSGAWVRDGARSKAPPYPNYWLTRAPAGGFNQNNAFVLKVTQTATGVQVTDPIHPQRNYVLDGKPHLSATDTGMAKVSTTATMAGDALTITTAQPYGGMPGNVTMQATESWRLSADGTELTITTSRELPAQKQSFTEVFKRQ
ncbi:MAG: hypothetical protein WCO82_09325, partial [Sphingomonadales bacterium]